MTYLQALAVGWSIYWRQFLWALALTLPTVILFRRFAALTVLACLALLNLLAFPRVIRQLPDIRYSGFRLHIVRGQEVNNEPLRWREAVVLSLCVNLVPSLCAPALWTFASLVPPLQATFQVAVLMPFAALMLVTFPWRKVHLRPILQ